MADTVTAPAAGVVFATDDIGGIHYPRSKLSLGVDGAATDAVGGAGPVSAAVLRITHASDDPAVALLTLLNGYVDGIEALLTALNALVTTQNGYLDGVEGAIASTNTLLTTQATYLDGVETALGAATPAGPNIIGKVGIDQTTPGTTNAVNIDASLKSGTATASTPAMTTASATVLASNANRKGATIYNPNAGALLLNLAGGNAATAPHARLPQYANYEVGSGYTGAITGALESGSANVNVVENT